MSGRHFETYDVTQASRTLESLCQEVIEHKGRIVITHPGCDDCCVLMSKSELASLEEALQILADTDGVKAMSGQIAQLAAAVAGDSPAA